ncbi:MAG: NAD-dependent epimerase/dehydratase family protein [Bacteroidales bacterium]|jgi:UDP-glucose 4-epimerase|nr:NAD-dependent epimerase/dehydratase family protein [Bacteroidales bacterium]
MRILITGGAGFLGSHIADALLTQNDEVFVIDNFSTGRRDNLVPQSRLTILEGDISDKEAVSEAFGSFRPEVVIHAAASYKNPDDWEEDGRTNVLGTLNIINACQQVSVLRLIYFQTALCYGLHPLEQPITLTHPYFSGTYSGGSSYAISKTTGEMYIALSGLDFISFRLANAYGPRNLSGPLPTFYHRLTNNKPCFVMDTRRDFIYCMDLVNVVLKAIRGLGSKGYYHISSGCDYSIKELFDATIDALGFDPAFKENVEVKPRNSDDVYTILIDPSKTNLDFAWKTEKVLADGVREAISYYKKYGISETYTHLRGIKE